MPDRSSRRAPLHLPGVENVEEIGRGGCATVYRGWQPAFNRAVAVKVLDCDPGGQPPARFDKEVRALGSLSGHPHVVAVYEAGKIEGRPYLVMPYLGGGSLQDRLRHRPLAPPAAVSIMAAIAGAVSAAHRLGILHRDIKPANILFTYYGDPQLADFGIAHFADSTLTAGIIAATAAYSAPEVLGGERASEAADVYSLGATLYTALGGRPAFLPRPGEAPIAFAVRVHSEPAPELGPRVPPALAAVVARAMDKHPSRRYPTADAFRQALLHADLTEPPAPPIPGRDRLSRLATHRVPRRALAAAAAIVVLGGGAAAGAELSSGNSPRHSSGPSAAPPARTPAPTGVPLSTSPTTAQTTAAQPPSAGGVTSASALSAAAITDTIDAYYALVNQHRLDESWNWLTSSYQQQLGEAYYRQFWTGIASVQLLSVRPETGAAVVLIRYVEANGTVSTESALLAVNVNPATDRILIGTYRSSG